MYYTLASAALADPELLLERHDHVGDELRQLLDRTALEVRLGGRDDEEPRDRDVPARDGGRIMRACDSGLGVKTQIRNQGLGV